MEQNPKRGMGGSPKPYIGNYGYIVKAKEKRLLVNAFPLQEVSTSHSMNRQVREPYAWWCERFSLSAIAGGAAYSIGKRFFIHIWYFVNVFIVKNYYF